MIEGIVIAGALFGILLVEFFCLMVNIAVHKHSVQRDEVNLRIMNRQLQLMEEREIRDKQYFRAWELSLGINKQVKDGN